VLSERLVKPVAHFAKSSRMKIRAPVLGCIRVLDVKLSKRWLCALCLHQEMKEFSCGDALCHILLKTKRRLQCGPYPFDPVEAIDEAFCK